MPRNRIAVLSIRVTLIAAKADIFADIDPPNGGRGAGTVPIWNPHNPARRNPAVTLHVLALNHDPIVPGEGNRRLSEVFKRNNPAKLAIQ